MPYREFQVPKKSGGFRTIYAPDPQTKSRLRKHLPTLTHLVNTHMSGDSIHGFMPLRSPVTNAQQHVGYEATLCMDLKDFFDTVSKDFFKGSQDETIAKMPKSLFYKGAARQGMPTSPAVANLAAAIHIDKLLFALMQSVNGVYTRYADDMAFSCAEKDIHGLAFKVTEIIEKKGFKVNSKKTRIMLARRGNRIITGVSVSATGISAPRRVRRRLRAAQHQGNFLQARGLEEWCKLKTPSEKKVPSKGYTLESIYDGRKEPTYIRKSDGAMVTVTKQMHEARTDWQFNHAFEKALMKETVKKLEGL